ncbi:tRNA (adenosine(37)-N6)-dimethylallyltransferase MiaA [Bacillus taeanensis]|uniref:tRNA dimethylallyltransferase n=1 Tax=Bacillus taeanensis TaxID=273032 RepID=A0A366XWC2_9BACI|nr:tRNA (adenosine(37)-N6)-dimethylallyltransferase MiaA [Bacillus taeanensis]RBW69926.1 tRNA (adenosine(37)-N6)-dimethylallyltransferase MiaA [Bacillus taeanensis]
MKEKVAAIVGPTAVGKTRTSIELAKALNGEVISGDSMQVYKGMDIGTAKIKEVEMQGVIHHLLDIKDPTESYSVADFQKEAKRLITDINKRGKLPIIVGGTGLYIKAVINDYQFSDVSSDEGFRERMELFARKQGQEALHEQLKEIDKESYQSIHPNNVRRVIRALEIYHTTGKTAREYQEMQKGDSPYNAVLIGLMMEREKLYARINERVDLMIKEGLIDEVRRLYDSGIRNTQAVQAIGYKEMYDYFDEKVTFEEAVELLKRNSRRYAKRQFTWFRNQMDIEWFNMENEAGKKIKEIIDFVAGKLRQQSEE